MSETYKAWDNNDYPSPPPADWYQAPDGLWWPQGYGPGPAVEAPQPAPEAVLPPSRPTPSADSYSPHVAGPGVGAAPPPGAPDFIPPAFSQPVPGADTGERFGEQPLGGSTFAQGAPIQQESTSSKALPLVFLGLAMMIALVTIPLGIYLVRSNDEAATADIDIAALPPEGTGPGSLGEPWSVGDPIAVFYEDVANGTESRWTVTAVAAASDSTFDVIAANGFNEEPPEGEIYVMIPVTLTYKSGPATAKVSDLTLGALGDSGSLLSTRENYCGALPDVLATTSELTPGSSISGNICWSVPESDLASLKLVVQAEGVSGAIYVDLNN